MMVFSKSNNDGDSDNNPNLLNTSNMLGTVLSTSHNFLILSLKRPPDEGTRSPFYRIRT